MILVETIAGTLSTMKMLTTMRPLWLLWLLWLLLLLMMTLPPVRLLTCLCLSLTDCRYLRNSPPRSWRGSASARIPPRIGS